MTKLHFYKGLRTIGGTVVEVETDRVRCLFDFGLIFQNVWEDLRVGREHSLPADYLKLGILPKIEGIYNGKDLGDYPLRPWQETDKPVFFLISHMHIDHMEALGFLAARIPVYMTGESLVLYQGMKQTGECFYRYKENCIGMADDTIYEIADISFRAVGTDHDVPGACGFEIRTEDGTVSYTGDLRLHGFHPQATLGFAKQVEGTDVLITEGVTASFLEGEWDEYPPESLPLPEKTAEEVLLKEIKHAVMKEDGITIINLYERNIERAYSLMRELGNVGIKMVWEPLTAYYIHLFHPEETLYVYEPLLRKEDYDRMAALPYTVLMDKEQILAEARTNRILLQLFFCHTFHMLDLGSKNSLYMHCDGVPLGDYDPAYEKLLRFIERFHIRYQFHGIGGHAYPGDLKYLLEKITPKYLVPLHSLRPEKVKTGQSIQLLPEDGSVYLLDNHVVRKNRSD